jgi:hypothetical protein
MNFVTQDSTKDPHFSVASRLPAEQGDLFAIIGRLWKRKLLILCLTALLATPIVLVIRGLTPWYRAEGQVMVEDRRTQVILVPDVRTDRPLQEDSILSEVQVLLSRDLAREVVKKLDLADDPEFNPPAHSSLLDQGMTKLAAVATSLSLPLPGFLHLHQGATPPAPGETKKETRLIDAFLTRLTAAPAGRSRVIRVMFESQSPQMAAKAVNALASVYLDPHHVGRRALRHRLDPEPPRHLPRQGRGGAAGDREVPQPERHPAGRQGHHAGRARSRRGWPAAHRRACASGGTADAAGVGQGRGRAWQT